MRHAPEIFATLLIAIVSVLLVAKLVQKVMKKVTIWEYEQGLLYSDGKFERLLPPGGHWIFPYKNTVLRVDMRERQLAIGGQELLSLDNVGLKLSITATYKVADPQLATNKVDNYYSALYSVLQLELREIVGTLKIDELLEKRNQIGEKLLEVCQPKSRDLGLELLNANVKDIMLAGEFKKAFGQVVKAQKEGQAALEKARGETAALRNLANAAKMLESNPALLQLRALQTMSDSSGNTLIVNIGHDVQPLPLKKSATTATLPKPESSGEE